MEYFTTTAKPSRRAVDCVIVGVYNRNRLSTGAEDIDAASRGGIKKLIKSGDIATAPGSCTVVRDLPGVGIEGSGLIPARGLRELPRTIGSSKVQVSLDGRADRSARFGPVKAARG